MLGSVRRRFGSVAVAALALATGAAACTSGFGEAPETPARPAGPIGRLPEAVPPVDGVVIPGDAAPGIDVSHHQGRIDWSLVAGSGTRFVFAKATEGRDFLDPKYLANKAGAEEHGLLFGAYHFANPGPGRADAIREANHFVDEARLRPGNLLPVLDLETTGGLNHTRLTRWILTWLRHVRDRLGVEPIVYTSPTGWRLRVGDTAAVARAGFEHLWVAHWGVDAPRLPAERWNGHGWTFWQRSACGEVPGIRGCVDLDVASRSLEVATIPTGLDTRVPVAGVTAPAGVDEPLVVTFDEPVVGVTGATVRLRAMSGGRVRAALDCPSDHGVVMSCATTGVQSVQLEPPGGFLAGERYRVILAEGIADLAGNALAPTTGDVEAPTELEQGSAAITYRWAEVARDDAAGGSYLVEDRPGATASFSFWGPSIRWVTAKGPGMGRAAVSVDGVELREVELRAGAPAFGIEVPFARLGPGRHTIEIEVLGTGEPRPAAAPVVVDAFRTAHGLVATPEVGTAWSVRRDGDERQAAVATTGASAEVRFAGDAIVWHTIVGPEHGAAAIYVDGVFDRVVDTRAPIRGEREVHVGGLAPGEHTVRIVALPPEPGAQDAPGAGVVSVDGFTVLPAGAP